MLRDFAVPVRVRPVRIAACWPSCRSPLPRPGCGIKGPLRPATPPPTAPSATDVGPPAPSPSPAARRRRHERSQGAHRTRVFCAWSAASSTSKVSRLQPISPSGSARHASSIRGPPSKAAIASSTAAFARLPHLVCYAVKANSNLAVLNLLARAGCGFDIVSGGELARVIAAGGDPKKIVFSGVGKTAPQRSRPRSPPAFSASMSSRTASSICSTPSPLTRRQHCSGLVPRESRRRSTHPSVHLDRAQGKQVRRRLDRGSGVVSARRRAAECRRARNRLPHRLAGHRLTVYVEAAEKIFALVDRHRGRRHRACARRPGWRPRHPLPQRGDDRPLRSTRLPMQRARGARSHRLLLEPGRFLVGNAGVLLTRILVPQARRCARFRQSSMRR